MLVGVGQADEGGKLLRGVAHADRQRDDFPFRAGFAVGIERLNSLGQLAASLLVRGGPVVLAVGIKAAREAFVFLRAQLRERLRSRSLLLGRLHSQDEGETENEG